MGILDHNPGDSITMWPRSRFYQYAQNAAAAAILENADLDEELFVNYLWMDHQFGALMDMLKENGVFDETLVILHNDHGQIAKGISFIF